MAVYQLLKKDFAELVQHYSVCISTLFRTWVY